MAQYKNTFRVDLDKNNAPVMLKQIVGEGNSSANRIAVDVYENGQAVQLGGSCTGYAVRADGVTVVLTGTINGNQAYIVLDGYSCAVPGIISVAINWTNGDNVTTLLKAIGNVEVTQTGSVIPSGTPINIDTIIALLADFDANLLFSANNTIITGDGTQSAIADHDNVVANRVYRLQLTTRMSWLPSDYPTDGSIHFLLDITHPFNVGFGVVEMITDEYLRIQWVRSAQPGASFGAWYKEVDGRIQIPLAAGTNTIQYAVELAVYLGNTDVILQPGNHVISNFDGLGMSIGNNVRVIGSADAVIVAHNTGTNQYYSPFYCGKGNFELNGVNITAKNLRYCVHDDPPEAYASTPAKHIYKNCSFYIDNTGNTGWTNHQCIGGGMGLHTTIEVENCYFAAANPDYNLGLLSYHNNGAANAQGLIVVKDSYFDGQNGNCRFGWYGVSTKITKILVFDCFMQHEPVLRAETAQSTVENMEMYTWNVTDGSGGGGGGYTLPLASSTTRGGVKTGYTASGLNIPVKLSNEEKMYVELPRAAAAEGGTAYTVVTSGERYKWDIRAGATLINTATDLDTLVVSDEFPGIWRGDDASILTHAPISTAIPWHLETILIGSNTNYQKQIFVPYSESGDVVYVREKYNSGPQTFSWSAWKREPWVIERLAAVENGTELSLVTTGDLFNLLARCSATMISSATDVNTLTAPEAYPYYWRGDDASQLTHAPISTAIPWLLLSEIIGSNINYQKQTFTVYSETGDVVYVRQKYATSGSTFGWGSWTQIPTQNQIGNLIIKGYCTNLQTKTINVYKEQPIIINVFRNAGGENNYVKFVFSSNEMVEVERIGFSVNDIVPTYQDNILTLKNNINGYVYYAIE